MSSPRHVSGPQSSDTRTPSSFSHFLRGSLFRLLRLIGNSLLYGSIFALITGSIAYAATGTKMLPNFLSSGVDFISFFSDTGTGNAGVDAKSYYARSNGSWIGYPGNGQNYNYLRNHTFLSGTLIDEDDNNYYMNPNGTSVLNYLYLSGVLVDLQDSNYFINMNGGSRMSDLHITGKVYDSANTNYYLDPNGTTNLNQLCLNGICKNTWPGSVASLWNQSGNDISSVNSGNVGIGTTSPDHKLDVNGVIRVRSINNEGGVIRLDGNNGILTFIENLNGVFRLINSAWSKELMKVDQDGNMDVAGKITTNQLCLNGDCKTGWPGSVASLWNQSGNDISSVNSGNVGIGTTSPDHKLDVNGFIRVRSINNEGGVIRLDGNNGIHTFIENLNGVFRLINSAWSKELMKVDQDGNMDVAGKITTNQLCLNGDCKTGWPGSGEEMLTYIKSHSGTYSCNTMYGTVYGVINGTSLRAYVKNSGGAIVADSGWYTPDNHSKGTGSSYATTPVCYGDSFCESTNYSSYLTCELGITGPGCVLKGSSGYVRQTSGDYPCEVKI